MVPPTAGSTAPCPDHRDPGAPELVNPGPSAADLACVRDPPQSAPAAPLPGRSRAAETPHRTGRSQPVPRPKADPHRLPDQRIPPGRMTWTRFSHAQSVSTSSASSPAARYNRGCPRSRQEPDPGFPAGSDAFPANGLLVSSGRAESPRDSIIGKQVTPGRRRATERFEANRRQSVQEPSPTASDRRCDDESYFVDGVRCEQRLGDRDAGVDANVTAGRILEVLHELDQPAFDRCRTVPLPPQRCGRCDVLSQL